MSERIEKYKYYYEHDMWTKEMVDNLYLKEKITKEEYDYIIGG